jgi:WhiB family redox-sensing transcriptional regulator
MMISYGVYESPRWQFFANCAGMDPELFFPERGMNPVEAKAVCGHCEVRADCLEYALAGKEEYGIWGGCTPRERKRELRERRKRKRLLMA